MKVKLWSCVGLLLLGSAIEANLAAAQGRDAYVGFGLGHADDKALNDTDTGFRLFGGFRFNKHLALVGGPVNLGTLGPENLEKRGFLLQAEGIVPIGNRWELLGKAGFYDWEARAGRSGSKVRDGTDPSYGVGFHYHAGERWSLRAEWDRFRDVREGDVDFISISAVRWFAL